MNNRTRSLLEDCRRALNRVRPEDRHAYEKAAETARMFSIYAQTIFGHEMAAQFQRWAAERAKKANKRDNMFRHYGSTGNHTRRMKRI